MVALEGEFIPVKVNKYGKKTHKNIRALEIKMTNSEITIKAITGDIFRYNRNDYEAEIYLN